MPSAGDYGASLAVVLLVALLSRPSLTMGVSPLPEDGEGLVQLRQSIMQLTQRFATLEVSLESRLRRLTDTAVKGEALIESLSSRLAKVDALVEKVDAMDSRLSQETSSLRSSITTTNRDLQAMSTRVEELDVIAVTGRGLDEDPSHHEIRSSLYSSTSDAQALSDMITRSVGEEVKRALPQLLDHSLATFHNSLYKRLSKSVGQLQEEVREARNELEHLGTQTLTTATGARQDIQQGGKTTQDAVADIKNRIHSVHRDLALKISSAPSLTSLEPVLQQVNNSVVESIARAAAGLNVTLLDEAARRRGSSGSGLDVGERPVLPLAPALHCPDPTTVTALLEVKHLLQSLMKKSEDLRRGLTKQTSEGVDLLKLLHQRFSVLVRRMNTDPEQGQVLVSEMQDLGSLVESSYMAVMMAQTAFIDSCKRIQEEEPMLELKMTELLDKLVTNIDLGYQHNRQQLSELKEVVSRLGERAVSVNITQSPVSSTPDAVLQTLGDAAATPGRLDEVQDVIIEAIEAANLTVMRLERVEGRVDEVAADLLNTDWTNPWQKDPADQLVTAAKDLKGYAQEQIIQALDLHEALLLTLEQLTSNISASHSEHKAPSIPPPLQLLSDTAVAAAPLTLPATCTAALLQQVHDLQVRQTSTPAPAPRSTLEDGESEDEEEEHVPAWYTDPDFLSGNYGTPDRGFPVFREEEWVEMDENYPLEEDEQEQITPAPPPPATTPTTTAPRHAAPGGVDRYFGVS